MLAGPVVFSSVVAASADDPPYGGDPIVHPTDRPRYAVEDYVHPNAESALAEHGVRLGKGDGGIMYSDCDPSRDDLIRVTRTAEADPFVCFLVVEAPGFLELEVPGSFVLRSSERYDTTARVTQPGSPPRNVEVARGTNGELSDVDDVVTLVRLDVS